MRRARRQNTPHPTPRQPRSRRNHPRLQRRQPPPPIKLPPRTQSLQHPPLQHGPQHLAHTHAATGRTNEDQTYRTTLVVTPGGVAPPPPPRPGTPEVDELTPRPNGGNPPRRSNCRLAHTACNSRRSNMDLNTWHTLMQQQAEPTKTRHTERRWW